MPPSDKSRVWTIGAVCVLGPALVALIPMAAAPAMPAMAKHFSNGVDGSFFAQMVMTVPAIMLILAAPLAGVLAARFGRRITLLWSLFLYIIGGAGVLFVDTHSSLMALRLLLGVAGGGLLTASLALIGDNFEGIARERLLGYATSVSSLVAALALIFGGALVDALGWRAPFALYLLAIPVLIAAYYVIAPSAPAITSATVRPPSSGAFRAVAPYYLLLFLLTIGMFTPAIQVPFILESKGITSASLQGTIISATSVVAIFSAGLYGWGRRWLGVHGFMVLDALSMAVGIALIAMASSVWVIFAGCLLVGVGAGLSEPSIASLIFDRTPPYVHALAMGLIVSALNLGQFVNPLAMAPLRIALGTSGSFLVLAVLLASAAVFILWRQRGDVLSHQRVAAPAT